MHPTESHDSLDIAGSAAGVGTVRSATRTHSVGVIVGSLRHDSMTRKFGNSLIRLAPDTLSCRIIEIGDLPLYNEDLDTAHPPTPWQRLRNEVSEADAILFVTPEHNRSVPAALKNAIDIGSSPANIWAGKPAAVASASAGRMGAFGANHHLRQSLVFLDMPTMQQPELYIGSGAELHDLRGELTSADIRQTLEEYMRAFANWTARNT